MSTEKKYLGLSGVTKIIEIVKNRLDKKPGKHVQGDSLKYSNVTYTAGTGAEIFNGDKDGNFSNVAVGDYSHAEGYYTFASGNNSHAEGYYTTASGIDSHAEGYRSVASGDYSHAEGINTTASEANTHAEGSGTTASGGNSHAEGWDTVASGDGSHASGRKTTAYGEASYSEGYSTNKLSGLDLSTATNDEITTQWGTAKFTLSKGRAAHAEGENTLALGVASHTEGEGTIAIRSSQHVQGNYNIKDTNGEYLHIVGNGSSDTARSNAHTIDTNGNAWYAGNVYIGGTGKSDSSAEKLVTQSQLATKQNKITSGTGEPSGGTDGDIYLEEITDTGISQIVDIIYPIGSIYMSMNSTTPATLFGGTWEQIQDRFLLAASSSYSAGSTGGEATHTLTIDEMPSHQHGDIYIGSDANNKVMWASGQQNSTKDTWGYSYSADATSNLLYTGYTGGGAAHNNMPPYLAVYMWKRTA